MLLVHWNQVNDFINESSRRRIYRTRQSSKSRHYRGKNISRSTFIQANKFFKFLF